MNNIATPRPGGGFRLTGGVRQALRTAQFRSTVPFPIGPPPTVGRIGSQNNQFNSAAALPLGDGAAARWLHLLRVLRGGAGAENGRRRHGSGFDGVGGGGCAPSCQTKSHQTRGHGGETWTHERTCDRGP